MATLLMTAKTYAPKLCKSAFQPNDLFWTVLSVHGHLVPLFLSLVGWNIMTGSV
jgi:hypothetical protein